MTTQDRPAGSRQNSIARRGKFALAALLLCGVSAAFDCAGAVTRVVYPAGEVARDTRYRDVIEMLRTALEKTKPQYGDYECLPSAEIMPKRRFLLELSEPDREINVIWNPTSIELEQRFLTIKISLRKDLLGYRIALIRKEDQAKLDQVKSIDDLKKFTFGQGVGWVDNAIYASQGITVVQGQYSQLFKMLGASRFDLFPRGAGEILDEYARNARDNPDIAIEQHLLIYYPFPYYFFFNRADAALKERVEAGLRLMQKDGSFDQIFNKYYRASIEKLNLKGRRVIKLDNPLLPKDTPLEETNASNPP